MKKLLSGWFIGLFFLTFCMNLTAKPTSKEDQPRSKTTTVQPSAMNPADYADAFQTFQRLYQPSGRRFAAKEEKPSTKLQWTQRENSLQVMDRPEAKVYTQLRRGVVAVEPKEGRGKPLPNEKPQELALRYIEEHPHLFGLKSPKTELLLKQSDTDSLGMQRLRYQQHHQGIPYWGRELTAHLDRSGRLKSITCLVQPTTEGMPTEPVVTMEQAIEIAIAAIESLGKPMTLTEKDIALFGLEPSKAELQYWQKTPLSAVHLVWVVELRPNLQDWMRLFVHAVDGEVLELYNATNFADGPATAQARTIAGQNVTINTYQIGDRYYMIDTSRPMYVPGQTGDQLKNDPKGVIWTLDLRNADLNQQATIYYMLSNDNTWQDESAVSAHYYTGLVYNYFKNLPNYSRNSFDNQGKTMLTIVRVGREGQPMDNAFWNGSFVSLGDGKQITRSWAGALDFVAHEFTHAHIQYTADLEYKFQSGALNETYADIGGVCVDTSNYYLGEDIVVQQYFPSGRMRDMSNPHNGGTSINDFYWQPAHMNEYLDLRLDQDNGGVHINNGITNLAAYKILNGLGRADGGQVLWRTLVNYLGKQSNFTDFRIAAVKSAGDIFGEGSAQQNLVKKAFDDVGIVQGSGTQIPVDTPQVSGTQYILMINEYNSLWNMPDNSLVITNGFTDVSQLSSYDYLNYNFTQVNVRSGRPLAVDTYGQNILFCDSLYNLRYVNPDGSGEEVVLPADSISGKGWWSVAISPSGRRVALTRNVDEKIIVVFDLETQQISELTLFLPTTDHDNAYADVVKFADAMVFIDDQLLAYDCLSSVQSPSGQGTLTFWSVNVIDVVSGKIFSVLPPQREGVNIANPLFASTNKNILCVEVFQEGVFNEITGINLASGNANVILNNGVELGFPDYSVDDQYMLFTRSNQYGLGDVRYVEINPDKISAGANTGILVQNARQPIWFVQGTPPTVTVSFAAGTSSGLESVTTVNIPVILSGAAPNQVTVDYAVTGGNAIGSGVDYTLEPGMLTFNPGETSKNIVMLVVDDNEPEGNETVTITLSRPVNAWMGEPSVHTYTILDNDQQPPTATPTPTASATQPPPTATYTPTGTPTQPLSTATRTPTATATQPLATATRTPTVTRTPPAGPTITNPRADINQDGVVDYRDLYLLMENWQRRN